MRIAVPQTNAEFDAVRTLCWEYRDYLLTFPSPEVDYVRKAYSETAYTAMMEVLATEHSPPHGGCVLAMQDETPMGCGMFHTLEPGTAELKRIYVRPDARGTGLGRDITQALIDHCRATGFSRILMDTSRRQVPAYRLYLSMGFEERGPYQPIPDEMVEKMYFFEMTL
ncbi:GNAT family N-acetyltransferase [Aestuariivita boseongensis]|uniref:GNAT family N-acetyltransferase n=1 Tax=Aestuariivita boseongensis TaxID=1470562 RepID=UPI00067FACBA|nr:GNAT family N-acetyltransferase [Aestuariivita boseongensis]